jgi:serine/threonine-protein kinase
MLIGEPPFTGPTPQAVIARVLTEEPRSLLAQRRTIPPHLDEAVQKALAKLPADRFTSAAEFAAVLSRRDTAASTAQVAAPAGVAAPQRQAWRQLPVAASIAVAVVSVGIAAWALSRDRTPTSPPVVRFDVTPGSNDRLGEEYEPLAISPDGQTIAVTVLRSGNTQLHIRRLGESATRPLAGTESAASPTFTLDGNWLAFSRGTALYKMPVSGGTPTKVADVPWSQATTSWAPDGSIMVGSGGTSPSLYRLTREGGSLEAITAPDTADGEIYHHRPLVLPGGEYVLFEVGREDGHHPALLNVSSGRWADLGLGVARASTYSAGHLLYAQANRVMAVAFNLARGEVAGRPFVVDSVATTGNGPAHVWNLAAAPGGSFVFTFGVGGPEDSDLIWIDRNGTESPTGLPRSDYDQPRVAPDGQSIVSQGPLRELIRMDLRSGGRVRLAQPQASLPEWSPDGQQIAFGDAVSSMWIVPSDGSSPPTRVVDQRVWPYSWSSDGNIIAVYQANAATGRDLLLLRRDAGAWKLEPFLASSANERSPAISPDGRWLAYTSDESSRDEIYVRSFPSGAGKWPVSNGGGRDPVWSRDSREVFYRRGREIFVVRVGTGSSFEASTPVRLLTVDASMTEGPTGERDWDVAPDGRRFLFMRSARAVAPFGLRVVLNFPAGLRSAAR